MRIERRAPKRRYEVVVWHGESRSLFYVVDMKDGADQQVLKTFYERHLAEDLADQLNNQQTQEE